MSTTRVRVSTFRETWACKACGRRSKDVLCCVYDPRELPNGRRAPGSWCHWCGADLPVHKGGQSFCDSACAIDYHEDARSEHGAAGVLNERRSMGGR